MQAVHEMYGARVRFDQAARSHDDKEIDEDTLYPLWQTIKSLQMEECPQLPSCCVSGEDFAAAEQLSEELRRGHLASSIIDKDGRKELRDRLDSFVPHGSRFSSAIPNPSEPPGMTFDKKEELLKLNERPAKMCEIMVAGWIRKFDDLETGATLMEFFANLDRSVAISDTSDTMNPFGILARQMQKSVQVALILGSLCPVVPGYHAERR
jgi:hypothetical protein